MPKEVKEIKRRSRDRNSRKKRAIKLNIEERKGKRSEGNTSGGRGNAETKGTGNSVKVEEVVPTCKV